MRVSEVKEALQLLANREKALHLKRFFKTGRGQYAEGDEFIGVSVPEIRKLATKAKDMSLSELQIFIRSCVHEERLFALIVLLHQYKRVTAEEKKSLLYGWYHDHIFFINNWDLVDISAPYIVGDYLFKKEKTILFEYANSSNIWKRRISILSTFFFIKMNEFTWTMAVAEALLLDSHDLIHKAVGWMLREIGKRDKEKLCIFLDKNGYKMPRTMLRYAIEKFSADEYKKYLLETKIKL